MLGQNHKENHRIKFELVVEQVNITCADISKTAEINNICLQLVFHGSSGKETIETDCITNSKRVSATGLQYMLTWKHHQILKFSVTLTKRKGVYDKAKKQPELLLSQVVGYKSHPERLGSAKLDVHEHANKKVPGQTYEQADKISISNKKIVSCELMVRFRIPDTDPSVIDTCSIPSSVITPSVSIETINSLDTRTFSHRTLDTPIYKLLNEIHLIGVDGNLYSAEWSKMKLIFFVFGTMPDFMRNLKDLIHTLQADRTIGLYVEVVHICQGELAAADVLYPYLPRSDYQNPTFHHLFNIQQPHADHPKICVVNERMTEFYVVEAYQIEKYVEERNPLELYYLWNKKKPPSDLVNPQRSSSLHEEIRGPKVVSKSNSLVNINHHRSSSYDGSSPSSRSSIKEDEHELPNPIFSSSPYKPPRPPPLAVASKVISGDSTRKRSEVAADLNMYNILVENIHSRIINFMMDLLTAGRYTVCQEDKENICESGLLILTSIETCVPASVGVSPTDASSDLLAPPKPPRSFSGDRKRKISKLYAKEREDNPLVSVLMYQKLIADIHKQLTELIQYLKSPERTGIPDVDKQAMIERIQLVDTIAESCKALSSESDYDSINDNEEDFPVVLPNPLPRHKFGRDVSFDVPGSIVVRYNETSDQEEHLYETLEGSQKMNADELGQTQSQEKNPDETGAGSMMVDKLETQNAACNGICDYPCDCTYSTVTKNFSEPDYHIDVRETNDSSDEADSSKDDCVQRKAGGTKSLVRKRPVKSVRYSIETIEEDAEASPRTSVTREDEVSAAVSFNDLSEMDKASSYYSSTSSLTPTGVREKIKMFTDLQNSNCGYIEKEKAKKQTKKSLKKWLSKKSVKKSSVGSEKDKKKAESNSPLPALKKFPAKSGVSVRKLSTGVNIREIKKAESTRVSDKKGTKQLKIRLKNLEKREAQASLELERALVEVDEWKSRFDGVYSKMMQETLNSSTSTAVKVTESAEYKELQAELATRTESLNQLRDTLQGLQVDLRDKEERNSLLEDELKKIRILEQESRKMLEKCQKENTFFRQQVKLRGNLALRSGTFNLFKTRWFQLESRSSHTISPVISFYSGSDRLGQIVLAEIVTCELVTGTQFRLSTKYITYVLNAENTDEAQKWLSGIEILSMTFLSDFSQDEEDNFEIRKQRPINGNGKFITFPYEVSP